MGKTKLRGRGIHTAVVLPPEVLDRLRQSERGVSEEIRRRIALTLEQDAIDPATRELLAAVTWIAGELHRQSRASWHAFPKAHEALSVAIQTWLEMVKPKEPGGAANDLLSPDDPPTLGRSIARHYQRFKAEMEKTDRELRNLSQGKGDKS
jgi:hypothetical protein